MTPEPLPDRADVLAMLAGYGEREPDEVREELGSLEVTWLVAQVEQRYAVVLDLDDDAFAGMATVARAVDTLRAALLAAPGAAPRAAGSEPVPEAAGG